MKNILAMNEQLAISDGLKLLHCKSLIANSLLIANCKLPIANPEGLA